MRSVVAACGLALAAGCQSVQTTQSGAVGVERSQTMMLSSGQVNRSAERAYRQELDKAGREGRLNRDAATVARVRAIAARLIPQTRVFRSDAPGWSWETNVLTSKDVNAWCMPGGKMAVYTGLVDALKPTDDELAAIMGHEIAHALREHGRERASQAVGQGLAISVLGVLTGASGATQDVSQLVLDLTLNLPNSRTHESEADRIGVELAARAGFDPRAAATLWQKMKALGGRQPPQFLSTHPSHDTRIADLQAVARSVMPLYESARAQR